MIHEEVHVMSEPASAATEVARIAMLLKAIRAADIELGEEVVVVGADRTAELVAELARRAGAIAVRVVSPGKQTGWRAPEADVVVHVAETEYLGDALGLVRNQGRAVLLRLDAVENIDFDIYPDLHKRSIRLICPHPVMPLSPQELNFAQYISTQLVN